MPCTSTYAALKPRLDYTCVQIGIIASWGPMIATSQLCIIADLGLPWSTSLRGGSELVYEQKSQDEKCTMLLLATYFKIRDDPQIMEINHYMRYNNSFRISSHVSLPSTSSCYWMWTNHPSTRDPSRQRWREVMCSSVNLAVSPSINGRQLIHFMGLEASKQYSQMCRTSILPSSPKWQMRIQIVGGARSSIRPFLVL